MGDGKYCRLFIFSTHSSLTIPCPLSWYLNVFQQQETHYNRISFQFDSWYLFGQCDKKLSDKDIHERRDDSGGISVSHPFLGMLSMYFYAFLYFQTEKVKMKLI